MSTDSVEECQSDQSEHSIIKVSGQDAGLFPDSGWQCATSPRYLIDLRLIATQRTVVTITKQNQAVPLRAFNGSCTSTFLCI